jgi:lipopolysaccharide export system protein LptA
MNKPIIIIFLFIGMSFAQQTEPVEIQADRFEVDISSNQFVAQDNVVIQQGEIIIMAKRASYKSQRDFINIEGDVNLKYQDLFLRSDVMLFDRVKQQMSAQGHLQVDNRDINIVAEKLRYDIGPNLIYFLGDTAVNQKKNVIHGRNILYDVKKRKLSSTEKTLMRLESAPTAR